MKGETVNLKKALSFTCSHFGHRLVSAFQDKFIDQEDNRNYDKFKEYMLAKFGEVTFTSFVHMIINRSFDICKEMKSCNFNKHWKPYISRYALKDLSAYFGCKHLAPTLDVATVMYHTKSLQKQKILQRIKSLLDT